MREMVQACLQDIFNMNSIKTFTTHSPEETIQLAAKLSKKLDTGDFVALIGELGAGKTVFVKGLAKGLGLENYKYVNSPAFVLMREYHGKKNLYHFDVYRLEEKDFCDTLDYETYFYGDGITVVEWADKIEDLLPDEYLEITIKHTDVTDREVGFTAKGERFKKLIADNL